LFYLLIIINELTSPKSSFHEYPWKYQIRMFFIKLTGVK